jgi:amidophosphoribosyltransferase
LNPKSIVVVSSAPQIRYPDCYGIDMARFRDFVAFRAAIALLEEHNLNHIKDEVFEKCANQENLDPKNIKNYVKEIYEPFTVEQVSNKITELVTPEGLDINVKVVFQSIENLHKSIPNHKGDWYFSGNYPTPGGNRVVNKAFLNYYRGNNQRAY